MRTQEHIWAKSFETVVTGLLILTPSLIAGGYLMEHRATLPSPFMLSCFILLLALTDFAAVVILEPHRRSLSKFTMPALIGSMAVVLMFVLAETLNRFIGHMGYEYLTPFAALSIGLIYLAVLMERHVALKCHLCLNSIAIMLLWALGSIDRITMPF